MYGLTEPVVQANLQDRLWRAASTRSDVDVELSVPYRFVQEIVAVLQAAEADRLELRREVMELREQIKGLDYAEAQRDGATMALLQREEFAERTAVGQKEEVMDIHSSLQTLRGRLSRAEGSINGHASRLRVLEEEVPHGIGQPELENVLAEYAVTWKTDLVAEQDDERRKLYLSMQELDSTLRGEMAVLKKEQTSVEARLRYLQAEEENLQSKQESPAARIASLEVEQKRQGAEQHRQQNDQKRQEAVRIDEFSRLLAEQQRQGVRVDELAQELASLHHTGPRVDELSRQLSIVGSDVSRNAEDIRSLQGYIAKHKDANSEELRAEVVRNTGRIDELQRQLADLRSKMYATSPPPPPQESSGWLGFDFFGSGTSSDSKQVPAYYRAVHPDLDS